jgi:hypothetical protein
LASKSGKAICSCRMKPRRGSLPSRNRSSAAQTPAAVVAWMALCQRLAGGEDLAGEDLLHQLALAQPAHGDEHQHHVLHGGRHALAQDVLEQLWSWRRPRSPSRNFMRCWWPG